MSFIGLWITTTVTSYIMDLSLGLKLFKDLADQGYKINIERYKELMQELKIDNSSKIIKFIPFLNILNEMKKSYEYNQQRDMIFNSMDILDLLEEMTDLEKDEYRKKPTGWTTLILPIKVDMRLSKADKIACNIEGSKYEIYYEKDPNTGKATILKKTGILANVSDEKAREIVIESLLNYKEKLAQEKAQKEAKEKVQEETVSEPVTEPQQKQFTVYEVTRDELFTKKAEIMVEQEIQKGSQVEEEGVKKEKKMF